MYVLMGTGAVVITVAAGVVGVVALIDAGAAFGPATRVGVAAGLIGGTVLTLLTAFRMGGALSHHVGKEGYGARRMPLTGWSLEVGDRRVPHFFGTHLMQAGPVAGLVADLLLPRDLALGAVTVVAVAWGALTLVLFQQANVGRPLFSADKTFFTRQ